MEVLSTMVFSGRHFWKTTFSTKGLTKLAMVLDALQTSAVLHGGRNRVPAVAAPDLASAGPGSDGSLIVSGLDSRRRRPLGESIRVKADAVAAVNCSTRDAACYLAAR